MGWQLQTYIDREIRLNQILQVKVGPHRSLGAQVPERWIEQILIIVEQNPFYSNISDFVRQAVGELLLKERIYK